MGEWFADVIHAWRRLRSAAVFTLFSVLTLALGIGAVLIDGARPVIAGLAIGLGCGVILRLGFRPLFIRMLPAFDPLIVAMVPAAFIVASLIAGYFPARRAARVDPNVALRHV